MVKASDEGAAERRRRLAEETAVGADQVAAALAPDHRAIMAACNASSPDLAQIDLMRRAAHAFVGLVYAEWVRVNGPPKV